MNVWEGLAATFFAGLFLWIAAGVGSWYTQRRQMRGKPLPFNWRVLIWDGWYYSWLGRQDKERGYGQPKRMKWGDQ